jgi:hypothetical protein
MLILGLFLVVWGFLYIQAVYAEAWLGAPAGTRSVVLDSIQQEKLVQAMFILVFGIVFAVIGFGCLVSDALCKQLIRKEEQQEEKREQKLKES